VTYIGGSSEVCAGCRFWLKVSVETERTPIQNMVGHCRRFPPQVVEVAVHYFPMTMGDVWCGEFKKSDTRGRAGEGQT